MKLVRKIRLAFREGKSDKVYEVDLVELPGNDSARYLVNFRFGRRGSALREGTKTVQGVTLPEAEAIYQSIVVSKTNSGYWDESGAAPPTTSPLSSAIGAPAPDSAGGSRKQSARNTALLAALRSAADSKQRARIAWNLGQGEAGDALDALLAQANRGGEWIEAYSIAWALGRWRSDRAVAALEKYRRHDNANVREISLESLLLTLTPAAAASIVHDERAELPENLLPLLEGDEAGLTRALRTLEKDSSSSLNRVLTILYRTALFAPPVQRALLAFFEDCHLAPGVFKGLRHVFKAAELRVDYDMFACLAYRFDTTEEYFYNKRDYARVRGRGRMGAVSKEITRENSRLAYSNLTRTYLRRRAWRTLRRLGRADSPHYVALAVAALLRVGDADARKTRSSGQREYDGFAHLTLFNHILHGADPAFGLNNKSTYWFRRNGVPTAIRGEAFAHLWNRAPAAAIDLLKRSRCGAVHDAAIRMLAGQTEFLTALSSADVAQLLQSPYEQTARFALPLAQALFERGAGDENLLIALLRSPLQQARDLGVRLLKAQPDWSSNAPLLIELLLIFGPPVPELVDSALATTALEEGVQRQVLAGVITQLLARNLELPVPAAESLAGILARRLPAAVSTVPVMLLDRLLSEAAAGRQVLGARLLVASSMRFADIPGRLLQHIHGSAHEEVRAVAIALLAKQQPEDLLLQIDNLVELLHRGSAVERREMLALFERLATGNSAQEARVLRALSVLLFRADREQGQADDVVEFFERHGAAAAGGFDKAVVWRMLQAQASAAQRVGAGLLQSIPAGEFSVKQWAVLGQNAALSVRRYAMAAFEANESRIKQHTRDALRLLDGEWPDAREFGFKYFRERYGDADWSPEYIIGVCDSTQPEVQAFGREILQRFFQQQQGPQYLAALSEHPSINVQLFVSNFLDSHASGQRDRILALRDYFLTVLSQINKARVCKDRVLAFLLRESLRDAQVAGMVAEVFTRVSLTVVNKDRTQLIKALIALQGAYPALAVPVKALPVARTPRRGATGARDGV